MFEQLKCQLLVYCKLVAPTEKFYLPSRKLANPDKEKNENILRLFTVSEFCNCFQHEAFTDTKITLSGIFGGTTVGKTYSASCN